MVEQLLDLVKPDKAYFGEKDFQQLQIIKKMVSQKKHATTIVGCPIKREPDGLAMSSRNQRLSNEQRLTCASSLPSLCKKPNHYFKDKMPLLPIAM